MKTLICLTAVVLAGCCTAPSIPPLPPDTNPVVIDREVLTKCPDLARFEVRDYTREDVLNKVVGPLITAYRLCQERDAKAVDTLCGAVKCAKTTDLQSSK